MEGMTTARQAILLAEDDPDIAELIAECLQGEGYAVTVATDANGAVATLGTKTFALVLTDAFADRGPGATQWAEVERIRHAAGATPTIICTAHRAQDFPDFAARGFAAMLSKPFDLDYLLALIARLIAQPEANLPAGESAQRHAPPSRQTEARC